MTKKETKYVCLMYKRKLACFTEQELEKGLERNRRMEAIAERKIAPYRVGATIGHKKMTPKRMTQHKKETVEWYERQLRGYGHKL